jgi:hypothetical protein
VTVAGLAPAQLDLAQRGRQQPRVPARTAGVEVDPVAREPAAVAGAVADPVDHRDAAGVPAALVAHHDRVLPRPAPELSRRHQPQDPRRAEDRQRLVDLCVADVEVRPGVHHDIARQPVVARS